MGKQRVWRKGRAAHPAFKTFIGRVKGEEQKSSWTQSSKKKMSRKKSQSSGSKAADCTAAAVQGCGLVPLSPAKLGQCRQQEPAVTQRYLDPPSVPELGSRALTLPSPREILEQ